MIDKNTKVSVTNRDNGQVIYQVQAENGGTITRHFMPGQSLDIPFGELQTLYYSKGGKVMLEEILRINDAEVIEEIIGKVEPEYNYSAADVKELLLNGSLDQLKDCLDFAPSGVIELVRELAVSLEIDSEAKRKAITAATGFDVTRAIEVNREVREAEKEAGVVEEIKKTGERRVQPQSAEKPSGRRTEAPKYTPVGK